MSNGARLGVVVGAIIVVIVAFVALRPSDSSTKQDDPVAKTTTDNTQKSSGPAKGSAQAGTSQPAPITLRGGEVQGGVKDVKLVKGQDVRLQVNTDEASDTLHLHGYDLEKDAAKGKPAVFRFKANVEGVFELESHTAEDAGREPLIARVVVEPN